MAIGPTCVEVLNRCPSFIHWLHPSEMNLALVEQLKAEPRVLICGQVRTNEVGWWTANPHTGDRIEWIPPFYRCNALCPSIDRYIHTRILRPSPTASTSRHATSSARGRPSGEQPFPHSYTPIDTNITRIDQLRQIETHDMHTQAGRPAPAAEYELPCQRLRGASGGVRSILKECRGRGREGMKRR